MNDNIGPLALNYPLIAFQIFGFVVLIVLLNKFVFKPIFAILDERQRNIQDIYDQVEADRRLMEETRRQYEERLAGIEQDARERIQAAVKEAQQLRDDLVGDARRQAETLIAEGRNEVERERQKAFLDLRQQIVALTVTAAGKLVGESLDDAHHVKLVDDFIAHVGNGVVGKPGYSAPSGSGGTQRGSTEP
jgi:F-type H+-transporting ATPase subunit b